MVCFTVSSVSTVDMSIVLTVYRLLRNKHDLVGLKSGSKKFTVKLL